MKGSIVIVVVTIVIVVADVEVEVDVAADGNCYAKELHSPIDVGSEVCW